MTSDNFQALQSSIDSQQERRIALLERKVALLLKLQNVDVAAIEREFEQEERERSRQFWRAAPGVILLVFLVLAGIFMAAAVMIAIFLLFM